MILRVELLPVRRRSFARYLRSRKIWLTHLEGEVSQPPESRKWQPITCIEDRLRSLDCGRRCKNARARWRLTDLLIKAELLSRPGL